MINLREVVACKHTGAAGAAGPGPAVGPGNAPGGGGGGDTPDSSSATHSKDKGGSSRDKLNAERHVQAEKLRRRIAAQKSRQARMK